MSWLSELRSLFCGGYNEFESQQAILLDTLTDLTEAGKVVWKYGGGGSAHWDNFTVGVRGGGSWYAIGGVRVVRDVPLQNLQNLSRAVERQWADLRAREERRSVCAELDRLTGEEQRKLLEEPTQ